jgi:hypothetical protein
MKLSASVKEAKQKELKQDQKAHEAQAKADKLQRKALDTGNTKKAGKAQDKADEKAKKVISLGGDDDV